MLAALQAVGRQLLLPAVLRPRRNIAETKAANPTTSTKAQIEAVELEAVESS